MSDKQQEFANIESQVLTVEARQFLEDLQRQFGSRRQNLLQKRQEVQARLDEGKKPDFLKETQEVWVLFESDRI